MNIHSDLRKLHESVRGYPTRRHPDDGHTYTAVVEQYCPQCYCDQPCPMNLLLNVIEAGKTLLDSTNGVYNFASWDQKQIIKEASDVWAEYWK